MASKSKSTKRLALELGLVKRRCNSSSEQALKRLRQSCQQYEFLIIIDFESTCWEDKKFRTQEIIEFPAVLLNTSNGEIEEEFHFYVQPTESPILSEFCKSLTGITQQQVDEGIPIQNCLNRFNSWLRKLKQEKQIIFDSVPAAPGDKPCTFVTWSDWDIGVCLQYECRRKQLRKPPELSAWIDLRATYRKFYGRKPEGLNGALKDLGIDFEGREHSGLHDSRNTARLAWRMMCDGCVLTVTKTMAGNGRAPIMSAGMPRNKLARSSTTDKVVLRNPSIQTSLASPILASVSAATSSVVSTISMNPATLQSTNSTSLKPTTSITANPITALTTKDSNKPSKFKTVVQANTVGLRKKPTSASAANIQPSLKRPLSASAVNCTTVTRSTVARPSVVSAHVTTSTVGSFSKATPSVSVSQTTSASIVSSATSTSVNNVKRPGVGLRRVPVANPSIALNKTTQAMTDSSAAAPKKSMTFNKADCPDAIKENTPVTESYSLKTISGQVPYKGRDADFVWSVGASPQLRTSQKTKPFPISNVQNVEPVASMSVLGVNNIRNQGKVISETNNTSDEVPISAFSAVKKPSNTNNNNKTVQDTKTPQSNMKDVFKVPTPPTAVGRKSVEDLFTVFKIPTPPSGNRLSDGIRGPTPPPGVAKGLNISATWRNSAASRCTPVNLSANTSNMYKTPPMCECGRRTKRRIVQTPGANQGRAFYSCPLGRSGAGCAVQSATKKSKPGCSYFKWESPSVWNGDRSANTSWNRSANISGNRSANTSNTSWNRSRNLSLNSTSSGISLVRSPDEAISTPGSAASSGLNTCIRSPISPPLLSELDFDTPDSDRYHSTPQHCALLPPDAFRDPEKS